MLMVTRSVLHRTSISIPPPARHRVRERAVRGVLVQRGQQQEVLQPGPEAVLRAADLSLGLAAAGVAGSGDLGASRALRTDDVHLAHG